MPYVPYVVNKFNVTTFNGAEYSTLRIALTTPKYLNLGVGKEGL